MARVPYHSGIMNGNQREAEMREKGYELFNTYNTREEALDIAKKLRGNGHKATCIDYSLKAIDFFACAVFVKEKKD